MCLISLIITPLCGSVTGVKFTGQWPLLSCLNDSSVTWKSNAGILGFRSLGGIGYCGSTWRWSPQTHTYRQPGFYKRNSWQLWPRLQPVTKVTPVWVSMGHQFPWSTSFCPSSSQSSFQPTVSFLWLPPSTRNFENLNMQSNGSQDFFPQLVSQFIVRVSSLMSISLA